MFMNNQQIAYRATAIPAVILNDLVNFATVQKPMANPPLNTDTTWGHWGVDTMFIRAYDKTCLIIAQIYDPIRVAWFRKIQENVQLHRVLLTLMAQDAFTVSGKAIGGVTLIERTGQAGTLESSMWENTLHYAHDTLWKNGKTVVALAGDVEVNAWYPFGTGLMKISHRAMSGVRAVLNVLSRSLPSETASIEAMIEEINIGKRAKIIQTLCLIGGDIRDSQKMDFARPPVAIAANVKLPGVVSLYKAKCNPTIIGQTVDIDSVGTQLVVGRANVCHCADDATVALTFFSAPVVLHP